MSSFPINAGHFTFAGLFAEALDGVWFKLAVVIIAALASWFHNRNKKPTDQAEPWGGEDDENHRQQRPGNATPPHPNQPLNWEEELKRLLEGKPPFDGTAGTPPPPPIIRRQTPPPPPLPMSVARESLPTEDEHLASRESAATPWQDVSLDSQPAPARPLAPLEQSTHAYQRASQLHEAVAAHMQRVDEQTEQHGQPLRAPTPASRAINADARAVVALLRRPSTARQALLASFVLAPPKALES